MIERTSILAACRAFAEREMRSLQSELDSLNDSQQNETKSSAGDKHETSRELIAQELRQVQQAKAKFQQVMADLERIPEQAPTGAAAIGSIISTQDRCILLGAALGKVETPNGAVLCISMASPFGKAMIGQHEGAEVSINGHQHRIIALN